VAKTGNQLLAEALTAVSEKVIGNIVHSKNMKPKQQALLVKNGYLKPIIKGWYLLDADLTAQETGNSALWFESLWSFMTQYLTNRFDNNYWLSPEASLDIHTDSNELHKQIVVFVENGTEDIIKLPLDMSIVVTRAKEMPEGLIEYRGLKVYTLETALAKSVPRSFIVNPIGIQVAMRNANFEKLTEALLRLQNIASAGRIIGAYDALTMRAESKKLETIMKGVFENIKVVNPFEIVPVILGVKRKESASASRIRVMWQNMRQIIIKSTDKFEPKIDFYANSFNKTLDMINEIYIHDAYNSLSIEGYKVTPELIQRVSNNDWSPETIEKDYEAKNALAAKGYYDAFNKVKESLTEAYHNEDLNYLIDVGITQWYTALFKPCVTSGIISELELAGYRKGAMVIRGSRHAPPASEQLMDCMTAFKECIAEEDSFLVKAILGHLFFGYIHPYFDGNGRTARFLMNFLLIVGGYRWVVIKLETRANYLAALEAASIDNNIQPFVEFLLETIEEGKE